jgi:hypothetical protein
MLELSEWLAGCSAQVEQIERQVRSFASNDLRLEEQLESVCRRPLATLCEEMRVEREPQLNFVRSAVEREVAEGFYDLVMCEQSAQLECEWTRVKQRLQHTFELVDGALRLLADFAADMRRRFNQSRNNDHSSNLFLHSSSSSENNSMENNDNNNNEEEEESGNMKRLADMKSELDSMRAYWLGLVSSSPCCSNEESSSSSSSAEQQLRQLVRASVTERLEEVAGELKRAEIKNRVRQETNFTQMRQSQAARINELYAVLEAECNFLAHSKIFTHKQYERSVQTLRDTLVRLDEAKVQMRHLIVKFELQFEHTLR